VTGAVDDDEREPQRHTGHLIRRAQQLHVATWTRLVSTEVSTVQYSVLVVLEQRGELSQRELGDEVDLDRSTVADLVARMERHGLVVRRADPRDGRRKTVALTEHGRAERWRLQPLVVRADDELTGALPGEAREALRSALRELLAGRGPAAR